MADDDATLLLPEAQARRLLLMQAVDTADRQGKLISPIEREQAEQAALEASRDPARPNGPAPRRYLHELSTRVLAAVENRNPQLAALQQAEPWQRVLAWGLPALALLLGAGLERIDNPRQVNMLSPPLLAFLLWNILVYLGLLVAPLIAGRSRQAGPLGALQRALAGATPRAGNLRANVSAQFRLRWYRVAAALEGQRLRQVLHASAAAWAIGVGLSIVLGGLVREYRVGWESTLLDLPQVHALLRGLFAPVVALLPLEGFTLAELERMHFNSGAAVGRAEARHWIVLYLALLALVVVLPRAALAAYAAWRRHRLARAVAIDLRDPYFVEVLARVSPARVTLLLLARDAGARDALLRAMRQATPRPGSPPALANGAPWTVLTTPRGDALRLAELPDPVGLADGLPPPHADAPAARGWLGRVSGWWTRGATARPEGLLAWARAEGDLVLLTAASPAQVDEAAPLLTWLGKPVIAIASRGEGPDLVDEAPPDAGDAIRRALQRHGVQAEVLRQDFALARWPQEEALRAAIAKPLATHQAPGMTRLAAEWAAQHASRLAESMRLLAGPLLLAAREAEQVASRPFSLRHLVSPADREAGQQARQEAMAQVLRRLHDAEAASFAELARLHGIEDAVGTALALRPETGFVVRQAVDAPQAGMAGAASGAAAGATVDLMVGGLTLGAAAALGAVLGGGAAYVAAAWKNRAVPAGASTVQLGEEMLQTLTEGALLRYLGVIHFGRGEAAGAVDVQPAWRSEVVAAVESQRDALRPLWIQARTAADAASLAPALGDVLQAITRRVLARLAPGPAP